jgi:hypothetical protein
MNRHRALTARHEANGRTNVAFTPNFVNLDVGAYAVFPAERVKRTNKGMQGNLHFNAMNGAPFRTKLRTYISLKYRYDP